MQAARSEPYGSRSFPSLLPTQPLLGPPLLTSCSSEAGDPCYSQSASSTVVSPASLDVSEAPSENSAQSGRQCLQEQDYIGMAELSSAKAVQLSEPEHEVKPHVDEPDLRLGLALGSSKDTGQVTSLHLSLQPGKDIRKDSICDLYTKLDAMADGAKAGFEAAPAHLPATGAPAMASANMADTMRNPRTFRLFSADILQKGFKQQFQETSVKSHSPNQAAAANANPGGTNGSRPGAAGNIVQRDASRKSPIRQPHSVLWRIPMGPSWSSEAAGNGNLPMSISEYSTARDILLESAKRSVGAVGHNLDEAPPSKEQAVGWPPVRSYRRSAINIGRSRPAGTDAHEEGAMYVKVKMDGIPIGRKIDLNAYNGYDELLCALEGMFYSTPVGTGGRLLHVRDFVLTYEDRDGDWMLVGDVPWGMFIKAVRRLRITRASDAICVGSSACKVFS